MGCWTIGWRTAAGRAATVSSHAHFAIMDHVILSLTGVCRHAPVD